VRKCVSVLTHALLLLTLDCIPYFPGMAVLREYPALAGAAIWHCVAVCAAVAIDMVWHSCPQIRQRQSSHSPTAVTT